MHTSPLVRSVFLGGFFLLLCAAGCVGGDAPKDPYPTPDAGGGGHAGKAPDRDAAAPDTTKAGAAASRFPLVAGSTWTYRHVTPDKDPWDEVATLSDITYDGAPAFVLADQEDAQGAETRSTLVVQGTGVYRAFREVRVHDALALQVRYDPAFLRFDESWDTNGQTETLHDDWVQTCDLGDTDDFIKDLGFAGRDVGAERLRLLVDATQTNVQPNTAALEQPRPLPAIPYFDLDNTELVAELQLEI
ncbi:MAG TPA: hypothetical protein VJV78_22020 [Polyangiales bacterium]|nr:hypothetical protein [Polyangiales bacterium]